ncbi:MAG: methyltransferase domain-containing protein [Deltaproteobacteria bacterium]|nr:methyltransferase domain-containing protein [Deltaproteobacteria bacterium]
MAAQPKRYPDDHWLRSFDPESALNSYLDQQSKVYSKVKNEFVRELLGDLKGKSVIDYGCGAGLFSVHAAKSGAIEVIGVDAEESVLTTARYFASIEGVSNYCSFVRSDTFPMFTARRGFDVILMKDVIEHAPDDDTLLATASKALNPGGIMVISTQNSLSLNYAIQGTYHRVLRHNKQWFGWDETHLRFYTPIGLARKLKTVGLGCEAWRSVYIVPYKIPKPCGAEKRFYRIDALSWIDRALGGVFPYNRLGWNIIVRARSSRLVKSKAHFESAIHAPFPAATVSINRESLDLTKEPLA